MKLDLTPYQKPKFKKGLITCPICSNKDYYKCSVTVDDALCLCWYRDSERIARDGRYIHILKDSNNGLNQQFVDRIEEKPVIPVAEIERLDAVYRAFLQSLKLNEFHSNNLIDERGMSDTSIARNLYSSVPKYAQRSEVVRRLAESFDLTGIPGFYQENDQWFLNLNYDGFYIPFRDELGRIQGIQIRKDEISKHKFLWLSSANKGGAKSTNPLHIVNPEIIRKDKTVYITEGALKADVIAEFAEYGLIAVGGVSSVNPQKLIGKIQEIFPELEKVIIAFDMDWKVKEPVKGALYRLLEAFKETSLNAGVLTWDLALGKGLDDILKYANDNSINTTDILKYVKSEEFQEMLLATQTQENEKDKEAFDKEQTEEKSEDSEFSMKDEANVKVEIDTFGITCREFLEMELPKPERVISGLVRGNLGFMVATTNIGKTTLALNLSLSAGMSKPFSPLFEENHVARKVMYIDGEATKGELQADISKMLESCSETEQEAILDNLCFICDEELNDEPLDLVNSEHLKIIEEKALEFKPDLIIVDTLSALTLIENENDNAIVKKQVIQPLKNLAKKANAGVLVLHHSGKFIEGSPQAEDAYKMRGASAFGALARVVFNLKSVKGVVTLSISKVKGAKFEPVTMQLDANTRWFNVINGTVEKKKNKSEIKYDKVVDYVRETVMKTRNSVGRQEIIKALKGEVSRGTVDRVLEKAYENGDLTKPKTGFYFVSLNQETELELKE